MNDPSPSSHTVTVHPSLLWTSALVVPAAVVPLLPPALATMSPGSRSSFFVLSGAFVLMGVATMLNRITLHGTLLSVRGVVRTKTYELDSVQRVRVLRAAGRYNSFWEMRIWDAQGSCAILRLNGYSVASRRQLMSGLRPFLEAADEKEGPVGEALAGRLWFPQARSRR